MNFLTEKLAGRNNTSLERMNIPEGLPNMDLAESPLCNLAEFCPDERALQEAYKKREAIDKDLEDQRYELCTHPTGDCMREQFCTNYRNIKKSLVDGAELILQNWHPGQGGENLSARDDLREKSTFNRVTRIRNGGSY
jgi:hypothetical protein